MASTHTTVRDFRSLPGDIREGSWWFPDLTLTAKKTSHWQVIVSAVQAKDKTKQLPIGDYLDNAVIEGVIGVIHVQAFVDTKKGHGVIRQAVPTYVYNGKNLGKKSATNAVCQAMRDAYGLWLKKEKKTQAKKPPMLAQVYNTQSKHVFPCWVQRKYDGLRTVADPDGTLYSRSSSTYDLPYLAAETKQLCAEVGGSLDGELYLHGKSLQDLNKMTRGGDTTERVNFYIFDMFSPADEPYSQRKSRLDAVDWSKYTYCKPVETTLCSTQAEIDVLFKQYLAEGYEGAMIRYDAPYDYGYNGYHSKYLLKLKPHFDAEFPITSWGTGFAGKAENALMITCTTPAGIPFSITPAMELEERERLARLMGVVEPNGKTHFDNHYLGRMLKVYYDDLSNDGVPLRARTKMEIVES